MQRIASFGTCPGNVRVKGNGEEVVPDRVYSKKELFDYLQSSREKCRKVIAGPDKGKIK